MSENTEPINDKGDWHGYCERYFRNGQLMWKGFCIDGCVYGYYECYDEYGSLSKDSTGYYLAGDASVNKISNDNNKGYCYIWDNVRPRLLGKGGGP